MSRSALLGRPFLAVALQALVRNRMQTVLAMLGVMVGVGALVTSLALGRGAQASVDDQLRAAGANLIVVIAGNYGGPKEDRSDPDGDMGAQTSFLADPHPPRLPDDEGARLLPAAWTGAPFRAGGVRLMYPMAGGFMPVDGAAPDAPATNGGFRLLPAHYEDDPLAVHDHPTAKDRLGDTEAGLGSAATLTRADATAIAALPGVQHVVSGVHENAHVYLCCDKTKSWFTRLHGTEWALPEIRSGWTITHGRFLDAADADKAARVMVVGRIVADRLFGADANPVGRKLTLWNQPFTVIGEVGSRSWASQPAPGDDQFDAVYVPVTTINRLLNLSKLNTISITARSTGDVTGLAERIKTLLRQRHNIAEAVPDDFTVATMAQQAIGKGLSPQLARIIGGNMAQMDQLTIEQLSASLRRTNVVMLALLASVAAVSLLVGGIGVMNLLLLAVTQRTREVGLRIALGARRTDIAAQFVLEALMLCTIGGVLGILGGVLASGGLERFFQWSAAVSPVSALLALAVAALLGVVFSLYPARRAALLDPIEALRHE